MRPHVFYVNKMVTWKLFKCQRCGYEIGTDLADDVENHLSEDNRDCDEWIANQVHES